MARVLPVLALAFLSLLATMVYGAEQWMFQSERKWDDQWRAGQWSYMDTVPVERSKVAVVGVLASMYVNKTNADATAPAATAPAAGAGDVLNALDVGCGEGSLVDFLPSALQLGYVGVDLSREAVERGRKLRPGRKFVHAAAHRFKPRGNKSFHLINFADVLYYVDYKAVLRQYNEFLEPGGVVIISIFSHAKGEDRRLYEHIFEEARTLFEQLDEMDLSGVTVKKAHAAKETKTTTAFHIEVYRKRSKPASGNLRRRG